MTSSRLRSLPLLSLCTLVTAGALLGCGTTPKPPPAKPTSPPKIVKPPPASRPAPPKIAEEQPDPIPPACQATHDAVTQAYEPYLAAYSNAGIELSPSGKQLLFLSSRGGGSLQLFVGDARRRAAKPLALAPSKERVGAARFSVDGRHVFFTRDKDNNEKYQVYRIGVDGGEATDLTKSPERFYQLPDLSLDGKWLYTFRGQHKSPVFELVRLAPTGGEQQVIFKGKGFHYISDLSDDGKQALVVHIFSLSASELLLVDLASGKARRLAPSAGVSAHATMGSFAPDGKHVYVVTDEGQERAHLRKVALADGKEIARYVHPTGEATIVQAKKRALALLVDLGSYRTVVLLDQRLKPRPRVRMPLGSAGMGMLTRDGRTLVVTFSNPQTPRDFFGLDTRSGRLRPLRKDKRAGLRKLPKVVVKVERVPTFDGAKVPINVYLPARRKRGKKLPVLVSVHGGPASSSKIDWSPFTAFWIGRGFAVVEPNVRGSTGFGKAYEQADNLKKRLDAVKDLGAVNDWIRKQPWANPDRLVVFGGSYGGYMVYMAMGHQAAQWAAGVGLVGVVNLRTFLANTTGAIRRAFRDEFGTLKKDGPFLDSVSPLSAIDGFKRPLLIYQGATDPRVPRSEQDQLVRALRRRGVPVEYMVAADEGHSMNHKHNKLEFLGRMSRFLDQHLGLHPLPAACAAAKPKVSASKAATPPSAKARTKAPETKAR